MPLTNPNFESAPDRNRKPGFRQRKWMPAAACIAIGMTNKATAEKVGVHEVTIAKWRRHPMFQEYINKLHDQAIEQAIGKLANVMSKSADVIEKLLDSSSESIQIQATDRVKEWVKHFRNDRLVLLKLEELKKLLPASVPVDAEGL